MGGTTVRVGKLAAGQPLGVAGQRHQVAGPMAAPLRLREELYTRATRNGRVVRSLCAAHEHCRDVSCTRPMPGFLPKAPFDQASELGRDVGIQIAGRSRRPLEVGGNHLVGRRDGERMLAGQHLEGDDAQSVHITQFRGRLAARLFRAHVADAY